MTLLVSPAPNLDAVRPAPAPGHNGPASTVPVYKLTPRRARGIRVDLKTSILVDGQRHTLRLEPQRAKLLARLRRSWPWPVATVDLMADLYPESVRERDEHDPARRRRAAARRQRKHHKNVSAARDALLPIGLTVVTLLPEQGSDWPSATTLGDLLTKNGEPIRYVPVAQRERAEDPR